LLDQVVKVLAAAHYHPLRQLAIALQISHRAMGRSVRIQRHFRGDPLPLHPKNGI
jgi:hypothetical protein